MSLLNLVHCALALVTALAGLAALYLQLGAEFVGFAQILVYVGAVAILIVFAILLTRSGEAPSQTGWIYGTVISVLLFTLLGWAVLNSSALPKGTSAEPAATVKDIGGLLMTKYVLPLEVIGLLLTAAMIGAVIIALKEPAKNETSGRKT
jgi:NADH-quinone oxidoreductase subunit J